MGAALILIFSSLLTAPARASDQAPLLTVVQLLRQLEATQAQATALAQTPSVESGGGAYRTITAQQREEMVAHFQTEEVRLQAEMKLALQSLLYSRDQGLKDRGIIDRTLEALTNRDRVLTGESISMAAAIPLILSQYVGIPAGIFGILHEFISLGYFHTGSSLLTTPEEVMAWVGGLAGAAWGTRWINNDKRRAPQDPINKGALPYLLSVMTAAGGAFMGYGVAAQLTGDWNMLSAIAGLSAASLAIVVGGYGAFEWKAHRSSLYSGEKVLADLREAGATAEEMQWFQGFLAQHFKLACAPALLPLPRVRVAEVADDEEHEEAEADAEKGVAIRSSMQ